VSRHNRTHKLSGKVKFDLRIICIGRNILACSASKGSVCETKVSYGGPVREVNRDCRDDSFASFCRERDCSDEIWASNEDVGDSNPDCHCDGGVGCTELRFQDGGERFSETRSAYCLATLLNVEVRNLEIIGSNHAVRETIAGDQLARKDHTINGALHLLYNDQMC
jgi:hypothetical protein